MNATVSRGWQRRLLRRPPSSGYPDFIPLYVRVDFEMTQGIPVRCVLALLRRSGPDVVVVGYNFQSDDFRDHLSSPEPLLVMVARGGRHRRSLRDKEQTRQRAHHSDLACLGVSGVSPPLLEQVLRDAAV